MNFDKLVNSSILRLRSQDALGAKNGRTNIQVTGIF